MSERVTSKDAKKTGLATAEGTEANLDVVLKTAIEALTSLDAECLEVLSAGIGDFSRLDICRGVATRAGRSPGPRLLASADLPQS